MILLASPDEDDLVFWMLFTLGGHIANQTFEGYYGLPLPTEMLDGSIAPGQALCSPSKAMDDVVFLDSSLAVYEVELYTRLSAAGFHCSQFFYKAFMALYAGVLPEAALFRLWDRTFFTSGGIRESSTPVGNRKTLVELAFAVLVMKKEEGGFGLREQLLSCQTTAEVMDALQT